MENNPKNIGKNYIDEEEKETNKKLLNNNSIYLFFNHWTPSMERQWLNIIIESTYINKNENERRRRRRRREKPNLH